MRLAFAVLVELLGLFYLLQQRGVTGLHEAVQARFKGEYFLHFDAVEKTLVHGEQRHRHQ
jgi:hypothetical protein